jgi:hypothetical protein
VHQLAESPLKNSNNILLTNVEANRMTNTFDQTILNPTISTSCQTQIDVKDVQTFCSHTTVNKTETQPTATSEQTEQKSNDSSQKTSLHVNQQTVSGQSVTLPITDVFCFDEEGNFYIPDLFQPSNVRKYRV